MGKRNKSVVLAAAVAGVMGLTGFLNQSQANSYTWNGTSGSWEASTNWTPNTEPTGSDLAVFEALPSNSTEADPIIDQADSVAGITIDNSGGFIWNILRSGTSDARSLNIGSLGLSISGGGDSQWEPLVTTLAASQSWFVGSNTTLTFNGGILAGSGVLTKTGTGELDLTTNGSTNNAGINIDAGLVTNARTTNGDGTGVLSIYSGGTYEALSANIGNTGGIVMYNGSTLEGSGVAGISNGTLNLDSTPNTVVTFATATASSTLSLTLGVTGGDATSIINITGGGEVSPGGSSGTNAFQGTWVVNAGTLECYNINSLGDHSTTGTTTNVGAPSFIQLNGGAVQFAGTSSGSTQVSLNNPISVTATSTISMDKQGAGNAATSYYPHASRVLGNMTIGNSTLTVTNTSNITGVSNSGYPASFLAPGLTLTGTPTFNVIKPSGFNLAMWFGTITQNSSTYGFNVSGGGNVSVGTLNTGFSGPIGVSGSSTLQALAKGAFGSGTITLSSGSTALFANGLSSWTSSNSFAGTGLVQVEGGTSSISLSGGAISPGTPAGAAGVLTFAGPLALGKNGSTDGTLNINVAGTNGVAGTDFSQVVETNNSTTGITGLSITT
jgi:fibronectin-binding autotransporter adhesin